MATSDHIPIAMVLNVEAVPLQASTGNTVNPGKLNYSHLSKEHIDGYTAQFFLCFTSEGPLDMSRELKYLGHIFSDDLMDDSDIRRQCCKISAQTNMLLRKFSMCSADVKCALFKAYVTTLYTAHLWSYYRVKKYAEAPSGI